MREKYFCLLIVVLSATSLISCNSDQSQDASSNKRAVTIENPIINGFYADPSIVKKDSTYYLYATIDPWGGKELAVFTSKNFKNWERKHINWPTKEACTSPTSNGNMVWAPSVIQGKDGKYYMYISVGSEIWVGEADTPLGPWKNAKADDSPLIKSTMYPNYHMIDAEAFIDDDGQAYLYWGSGLNWKNGHAFVVKLKDDMKTFEGEPRDVTPPNFFEAPFMLKHNKQYYLMYSQGKTIDSTYKVRYAIGDTPYGPWKEGQNSPVIKTMPPKNIYGPGHHTVFEEDGQHYILYHSLYSTDPDSMLRQIRIDSLNFNAQNQIKDIQPSGVRAFTKGLMKHSML